MISFAAVGNDLYTGKRSIDFVGRQQALVRHLGGHHRPGARRHLRPRAQLRPRVPGRLGVPGPRRHAHARTTSRPARPALGSAAGTGATSWSTKLGSNTVRVQTEKLSAAQTEAGKAELAKAFGVPTRRDHVLVRRRRRWGAVGQRQGAATRWSSSSSSSRWCMAVYFRTWKMASPALVALLHDLVITVGIYALAGFEVTPASVIGFLTILGYSLYDTVVVFDKVRENTSEAVAQRAHDLLRRRPTWRSTRPWSARSTPRWWRCCRSPRSSSSASPSSARAPCSTSPRAVRRHRGRHLLLDLHRHAAAGRPARARAGDAAAAQAGRALPGDPAAGASRSAEAAPRPARRGRPAPGRTAAGRRARRPCRGRAPRVRRPAGAPATPSPDRATSPGVPPSPSDRRHQPMT